MTLVGLGKRFKDRKYGRLAVFTASGFHGNCRPEIEEHGRPLLYGNELGDVSHVDVYAKKPPLPRLTWRQYLEQQQEQQHTPKNQLKDYRPKEGESLNANAIAFRALASK